MVAMEAGDGDWSMLDAQFALGTILGKRYVDESSKLECLCTRAASGSLAIGTEPLSTKEAKPLPSSD